MAGFIFWCGFLISIAVGSVIFANTNAGKKFLKD